MRCGTGLTYLPIEGVTVIGLGHKARQGKDTTANLIIDRLGSQAMRIGFADALYAIARVEHGMTTKDPKLLQYLGTEVYRAKDPDVWLRALYHTLLDKRPTVAIVTDVRFPNEARLVKEMGGTLIKVERVAKDGTPHRDPNRSQTHPSETALDTYTDWDFKFLNVNDSNTLVEQVENTLKQKGLWAGPRMW